MAGIQVDIPRPAVPAGALAKTEKGVVCDTFPIRGYRKNIERD
jgi:hypothetical protein